MDIYQTMSLTQRTDITVPIMTPTNLSHPSPTSNPENNGTAAPLDPNLHFTNGKPYSTAEEDRAAINALSLRHDQNIHVPHEDLTIKIEAQSIVVRQGFNTRKAMRAYLDEEIARCEKEAERRGAARQDAKVNNTRVEVGLRELEEQYAIEKRVLVRKIEAMQK